MSINLVYRKLKGYKYELFEPVECVVAISGSVHTKYINIEDYVLVIKSHYAWDGPSGPSFDTKTFMRGSLIHDALYQLMREGEIDRKEYRGHADRLLREICLKDGMNKFRAWYVYHAVKMFSYKFSLPRKKSRGEIVVI